MNWLLYRPMVAVMAGLTLGPARRTPHLAAVFDEDGGLIGGAQRLTPRPTMASRSNEQ